MTIIKANWPAPSHIHAYATTRAGGVSQPPFHCLNLSYRVGDDRQSVEENHRRLKTMLSLPTDPLWLSQCHGNRVVNADIAESDCEADGSYSSIPNRVCAVQTADCLPILLCDKAGTTVAALHGGWRGLSQNIIANALRVISYPQGEWMAWLGPAIGPTVYEVGEAVYQAFISQNPALQAAFTVKSPTTWLTDLCMIASIQLRQLGISAIYGGHYCTYYDQKHFFSYRRAPQTGRMASLIWINDL